jgi:hypothetical protein
VHDFNDFPHNVTARATRSVSQQIPNQGADICFDIVVVDRIPIELLRHNRSNPGI